jgi:hypothetical protein
VKLEHEDRVRSRLVWVLLIGYFLLAGAGVAFAAASQTPFEDFSKIFGATLPTVSGFVGAALGFYFGERSGSNK